MSSTFNYLFLSDLHLSEGINPKTGTIHRNEDFFHDMAFAQFVAHHVGLSRNPKTKEYYNTPWKLVINGDVFDFLQVVSKPPMDDEGNVVLNVIDARGNPITVEKKLSRNEQKYGLGTTSAEIVWKLDKIAEGHPLFFQALAWLVAHSGNELVIMKGNHDIEMYWRAAQKRLAMLLVAAYDTWYEKARIGNGGPLVWHDDLPEMLTLPQVETAVAYPTLYYYEEGIFYAEHGCQYDPANWFTNFADPRLPLASEAEQAVIKDASDYSFNPQDYIELPSGSLFVRYFFNGVEDVHPFADNMKPISKYLFWLFRHATDRLFNFISTALPDYLRTVREVRKKTGKRSKVNRQPPKSLFEEKLFAIQTVVRQELDASSSQTTGRMVLSVVLMGFMVLFLLWGIRLLVAGDFVWMAASFVAAFLTRLLSSYLFQSLDVLLGEPFLYKAAVDISRVLNSSQPDTLARVPYHIFGHDHAASILPIKPQMDADNPRQQWYVNTGAWVPVFDEQERLLRDDEQLTFLRVVPSRLDNPDWTPPELLQWSTEANAPLPVRLFH